MSNSRHMESLRRIALITVTINCLLSPAALATGGQDSHSTDNDTTQYDAISDCSSGTDTVPNDKDKMLALMKFLVTQHGLTPIQAASIVGNLDFESGGALDPRQVESDGQSDWPVAGRGYGIAQWTDPGRQQGLVSLARSMHKIAGDFGVQMIYLWDELSNHPPASGQAGLNEIKTSQPQNIDHLVEVFQDAYERPADRTGTLPQRRDAANAAYALGKDLAPGGTSDPAGTCTLAAANGKIVDQAMQYVWPNSNTPQTYKGETRFTPATPRKKFGVDQPRYDHSDGSAYEFTDCGRFVATSVIASGADKNYPEVQTGVQLDYLRKASASGKLWQEIKTKSAHLLKPGDVLVANNASVGHTELYVGPQASPFAGTVAAASLGDHSPHMEGSWSNGAITYVLVTGDGGAFRNLAANPSGAAL